MRLNSKMLTLGIDTSNYTTSCAVYNGSDYEMSRKILDVKAGSRGIRQSEGVFVHNRELPVMLGEKLRRFQGEIDAVGVSTRPRSVEGSYMPVFTVGHGYAEVAAAAVGVKLYEFSHQDGHIMAGIYSSGMRDWLDRPFISVHISGGTTEILLSEYDGYNFRNEIIGGTLDISAGQLIDRIGVKMGLKFPCGRELESLALRTDKTERLPFSVKGAYINFSGVETKLIRSVEGAEPVTARTVLRYIGDVLVKAIGNAVTDTGINKVLIAGGVASNSIIRGIISEQLKAEVYFASKELSSDNAVGIAILAAMAKERDSI